MDTNKEINNVVIIKREHDKICILENIIKNINDKCITKIETIISNLIDSIIDKQNNIQHYVNALKKYINQPDILNIIVDLSISIANQTPYQMFIKNDK
jgi:hypothetical protein